MPSVVNINASSTSGALIKPTSYASATTAGSAVDVSAFEGMIVFTQNYNGNAAVSPTVASKIQHCATSGGTYTDVPGGGFTAISTNTDGFQTLKLRVDELLQFVKYTATTTTSSGTVLISANYHAVKKNI